MCIRHCLPLFPKLLVSQMLKWLGFSAKVENMVRPPEPFCLKRKHCSIPDWIHFLKITSFQFLFLTYLSLMTLDSFKSLGGCRCQDIILFQSSLSLLASASLHRHTHTHTYTQTHTHTHTNTSLYAPRCILTNELRSTDSILKQPSLYYRLSRACFFI